MPFGAPQNDSLAPFTVAPLIVFLRLLGFPYDSCSLVQIIHCLHQSDYNTVSRPVIPSWGQICLPGDILVVIITAGRVTSNYGLWQRRLLRILQDTGKQFRPPPRPAQTKQQKNNYLAQNMLSPKAEKPCSRHIIIQVIPLWTFYELSYKVQCSELGMWYRRDRTRESMRA